MVEAASLIVASKQREESGQPDDPGRSVDELHEWNVDDQGQYYRQQGPLTFEKFLQKAYWDQTNSQSPTGYIDPGWQRVPVFGDKSKHTDADLHLHRYADHNLQVPPDCERLGIGNADLRYHLGLSVGMLPFAKHSPQYGRARTITGCLRHSGHKIPEPEKYVI